MASVALDRPGRLPAETTSLVGRRQELDELRRLLQTARLVTLTGVGGVGKTRLALRTAADLRDRFDGGVWFADLSAVRDGDLLGETLLDVLGVPEQSSREAIDLLAEHVADRRLLLIMDTCEHLVDACAMLAEVLLRAAPGLRLLATSRQPLEVPGEHIVTVAPLPAGTEAVTLFAQRAAAVLPGFTLDERDQVERLCDRLDGIPLAIELAAARLRALSVRQIVERLDDRFQLTQGRRTALSRHQTLRAAVTWSHELCTPGERLLWARLSVFAGDFDLAAAEEVCADAEIPSASVFDLVAGLVEKSIMVREPDGRYRMLDTLREFGAEWLNRLDGTDAVRARHLAWYVELSRRARAELTTSSQAEWLSRLRREHPNVRVALEHAVHSGDTAAALTMVAALGAVWMTRGMLSEARRWIDSALAGDGGAYADRVEATYTAGVITILQGDPDEASAYAATAGELADGDPGPLAYVDELCGVIAFFGGDLDRARALLRRAGAGHVGHADLFALLNAVLIGLVQAFAGRLDEGVAAFDAAIQASEARGEKWCRAHALWMRGLANRMRGRVADGLADDRAALRLAHELDDRLVMSSAFEDMGGSALASGDHPRSARLIAVSDRMRDRHGASHLSVAITAHRELHEGQLREALGDRYDEHYAEGLRMSLDAAIRYALGEADAPPAPPPDPLTRREREIAGLVAEGLSNREIAERLVIAKRTADSHVEHILAKLDATSRTQIAAWITRHRQ